LGLQTGSGARGAASPTASVAVCASAGASPGERLLPLGESLSLGGFELVERARPTLLRLGLVLLLHLGAHRVPLAHKTALKPREKSKNKANVRRTPTAQIKVSRVR